MATETRKESRPYWEKDKFGQQLYQHMSPSRIPGLDSRHSDEIGAHVYNKESYDYVSLLSLSTPGGSCISSYFLWGCREKVNRLMQFLMRAGDLHVTLYTFPCGFALLPLPNHILTATWYLALRAIYPLPPPFFLSNINSTPPVKKDLFIGVCYNFIIMLP